MNFNHVWGWNGGCSQRDMNVNQVWGWNGGCSQKDVKLLTSIMRGYGMTVVLGGI